MIDNLLVAAHAFPMCMVTLFSVDEILLPRYSNWSTNSSDLPFDKEMFPDTLYIAMCADWVSRSIFLLCLLIHGINFWSLLLLSVPPIVFEFQPYKIITYTRVGANCCLRIMSFKFVLYTSKIYMRAIQ